MHSTRERGSRVIRSGQTRSQLFSERARILERIRTDEAPSFEVFDLPISRAIVHDDTIYVSGQTGVDPDAGEMVEGGLEAETRQALGNVGAILAAAGASFDDVLEATVILEDVDDFDTVNEVCGEFVSEPHPARSAVEVIDLAVEFAVELEVTAALSVVAGGRQL